MRMRERKRKREGEKERERERKRERKRPQRGWRISRLQVVPWRGEGWEKSI
jgi:hypothetical protein